MFVNISWLVLFLCHPLMLVAIDTELFQDPNQKYVSLNETVTISCRAKNTSKESFLYKRHGLIMSLGCDIITEENIKMKCGEVDSWYYMNATISAVTWTSRGEYICIDGSIVKTLSLSVSVPAEVKMNIANIVYNPNPSIKNIKYKKPDIQGYGTLTKPFKLLSKDIQHVHINCSNDWAFPPSNYTWSITRMSKDKNPLDSEQITEIKSLKLASTMVADEALYRSSSIIQLDCQDNKLFGLVKITCSNANRDIEKQQKQEKYFVCPDMISNVKANSVKAKKMPNKITTGEMVNIAIGCTIGMVLMVTGIVLICRHRTKDEMERYTMRQNSMEHSGYRV